MFGSGNVLCIFSVMKKVIFITLLTIITLPTVGQNAENNATSLSVGINLSPDIAYRNLESSSSVGSLKEEPKFGYTGGVNLKYNVTPRFSLEAGAQYSNKGYAFKNSELIYADMIDPRYGFVYQNVGDAPTHLRRIYNFHYFDIPVRGIFSFGKNKISFLASAGITTNILLKTTTTSILEYKGGKKEKKNQEYPYDFRKINISLIVSAGINYKINDKFNISAEPTFRYGILKITDAPVTAFLWNAGMNVSCYYVLK